MHRFGVNQLLFSVIVFILVFIIAFDRNLSDSISCSNENSSSSFKDSNKNVYFFGIYAYRMKSGRQKKYIFSRISTNYIARLGGVVDLI